MIALAKSKTKRDFPGRIMEAFDLYSPEIDADPFPYYEILREQYPCYWSESGKLWILSRYDDIVEATRDWETFSSSQGNMIDELPGRAGATLGTTDPPRHDRLRALSQAAFARRNVEQFITPTLEIADRALARICERKHFEFINDFSSQITVGVLFRTMGLPQRDHADIRRKVILAVSTDKSVKGRNAEHIAAFKELSDFLTAEVALNRRSRSRCASTPRRSVSSARSCARPSCTGKQCTLATRWRLHSAPAIAIGGSFLTRMSTTSIVTRKAISALAPASTSASAAKWRGSLPRSQ